jgi:hypothetical protein
MKCCFREYTFKYLQKICVTFLLKKAVFVSFFRINIQRSSIMDDEDAKDFVDLYDNWLI